MINCIFLVLLLLISIVLLKFINFSLVIPKLRPIVSSIGTFNYNLARFLCDLLSPLAPNYYSCKDTFSFASQIKDANFSRTFLVSSDITSLFSNIPLQEPIHIAINLIFNHNPNLNITKKQLKKIYLFAISQTYFIFNSKNYNQIDGVAMSCHVHGSCPC